MSESGVTYTWHAFAADLYWGVLRHPTEPWKRVLLAVAEAAEESRVLKTQENIDRLIAGLR